MTQSKEVSIEDYLKRNKVIADFMGYVHSVYPDMDKWEMECLKYHSDWNQLMKVVEKIGNTTVKSSASYNPDLMFRIEIVNGYTKIHGTPERIFYNSSVEGSMINATYKAVYHFITWYNKTLKKEL